MSELEYALFFMNLAVYRQEDLTLETGSGGILSDNVSFVRRSIEQVDMSGCARVNYTLTARDLDIDLPYSRGDLWLCRGGQRAKLEIGDMGASHFDPQIDSWRVGINGFYYVHPAVPSEKPLVHNIPETIDEGYTSRFELLEIEV